MTKLHNATARHPLSAALAHDLRTPLNQIIGYSELMIEQVQESGKPEILPDLQKVCEAGRQLLELINEKSDAIPEMPASNGFTKHHDRSTHVVDVLDVGSAQGLILVVDDIEPNRDVLSRRLESQGFGVATAADGKEALSMMRENGFDLVLLDILMPVMDGFEVLKQIKADPGLSNIPVIMISAVSELESVVRCIELGADDYVTKPFNSILLKARVSASLQKKQAHDRETALFNQLDRNFKRLQELEKLRDGLTYMIIHDLRAPLSSLIMGLQTMETLGELSEPQREVMAIATFGGDTLLRIVNELLDVVKLESGTMSLEVKEIVPSELVELAVRQMASLAKAKDQTVRIDIPTDLPKFPGDERKLSRVLVNLLGNAIKFTADGGEISVFASYAPGQGLLFSVKDTGIGIPAEALTRVFEMFGQVESHGVGTGLGLTFCKLAVEAHGGVIEVESAQGVGSTFSFTIPVPRTTGD